MDPLIEKRFSLDVSYRQIAVVDPRVEGPLNDWEPAHVKQGFSWREGSVSFRTLEAAGPVDVHVVRRAYPGVDARAARAIRVPFTVPDYGIKVGSVGEWRAVSLPAGRYALVYETGLTEEGEMWCRFTFDDEGPSFPEIICTDARLSPAYPLLMTARPA